MKHVTWNRGGCIDYCRVPVGTQNLFIGNDNRKDVKLGSYQHKLHLGRTLVDVLYVPHVQINFCLYVRTCFNFSFSNNKLNLKLDSDMVICIIVA